MKTIRSVFTLLDNSFNLASGLPPGRLMNRPMAPSVQPKKALIPSEPNALDVRASSGRRLGRYRAKKPHRDNHFLNFRICGRLADVD
jgi:hypothetical protein